MKGAACREYLNVKHIKTKLPYKFWEFRIFSNIKPKGTEMSKPSDRFSESAPIANEKPAGGYIPPTNLKPVPERPAPTADQFGGFKRN
jgi:hypothetical protein